MSGEIDLSSTLCSPSLQENGVR